MSAAIMGVSTLACAGSPIGMRVIDSGERAHSGGMLGSISWVDNERVLFIGEGDASEGSESGPSRGLRLWNVSTGEVEEIQRDVSGFVYAKGLILTMNLGESSSRETFYETRRFGTNELVNRVEVEGPRVIDKLNARVSEDIERPGAALGRYWRPLRDGDGVLDLGPWPTPGTRPPAVQIQHRDTDNRVLATLDLMSDRVDEVEYIEFLGQYFLYNNWGVKSKLDDENCTLPADWFPRGSTALRHTEIPGPCSITERSGPYIYPTRAGYVVRVSGGTRFGGTTGTQGLHLLGGEVEGRVLGGFVELVAVSPDGCKVAAIQSKSIRASLESGATIKAFDICSVGDVRWAK